MESYQEAYQVRGENSYRARSTDSYSSRSTSQMQENERREWSSYRTSRNGPPYGISNSQSPGRENGNQSPFRRSRSRSPFRRSQSRSPFRSSGSPSTFRRSRSPSTFRRSRSPSTFQRSRSPSTFRRSRSPSTFRRSRSPSTFRRSRSPSTFRRSRSPSTFRRSRSPSTFRRSRSPSTFRRSRSPSTFRRSRSPSFARTSSCYSPERNGRSCSPFARDRDVAFPNKGKRHRSSSMWECAVCLETFNDRKDLSRHLSDSGHTRNFRDPNWNSHVPQKRQERHNSYSNPPYMQHPQQSSLPTQNSFGKDYSFRKRKRDIECFICHEQFSSHGELESHIAVSGHRWSYKKAQQLKKQARTVNMTSKQDNFKPVIEREREAHNPTLSQSRDDCIILTSISRSDVLNAIRSPEQGHEIRNIHSVGSTSAVQNLALEEDPMKNHVAPIPLEVGSANVTCRDPRSRVCNSTRIEDVPTKADPSKTPKWSPILQRGFVEGIPWKLIPILLTSCRPVSEMTKHPSNDDRGIKSAPLSKPIDVPVSDNPTDAACLNVSSSNVPPCTTSMNEHALPSCSPHKTDDTSRNPPKNQTVLLSPDSTSSQNNHVLVENVPVQKPLTDVVTVHVPTLGLSSPTPPWPTSLMEFGSLEQQKSCTLEEGDDDVFSSQASSPTSEPETITTQKTVDSCQHCHYRFCISRFTINVSNGDVTTYCAQCGTRTVMEGVFRLT